MNVCLFCGKIVKNKFCNISCQNQFQNAEKNNKMYGKFIDFEVLCSSCNNKFIVNEREKLYPQKNKYFCSRSCANKRTISEQHKSKTSLSLKNYWSLNTKIKNVKTKIVLLKVKKVKLALGICEYCGISFKKKKLKQRFCGRSCSAKSRMSLIGYGGRGGLASVLSQNRRSKNEVYFYELCKNYFKNVLANKPIFNGWDSDIIIEDFKIAVLWNGVWHYKKITKKHSVKQVQNRDFIKISEIKKCGYEPYIIKDLGKFNKFFVEEEFNKLKKILRGRLEMVSSTVS